MSDDELVEMLAKLARHEVVGELAEQRRDEDAGGGDADGDPDRRADDEPRPQAAQERRAHPNRYPRPRIVLMTSRPSLRRSRAT